MAGPLLVLFGKSLFLVISSGIKDISFISGGLFAESLLINFASAILCCIFGVLASLFIWTFCAKYYRQVFLALLLCSLIPPFIHVHSWIKFMDMLINSVINPLLSVSINFTGVTGVIWTTVFSYLPYTTSFCLMGLFCIPKDITDLMKTESNPKAIFAKCVVPYFLPYALISGLFIFLINMNDYAIPSAFGVNVFALELFSLYSASGNIYSISLSSFPLILISVAALVLFGLIARENEITVDPVFNPNPFNKERFITTPALAGGLILILFAAIPIFSMIVESFHATDFFLILADSRREILYSFVISICTAFACVIPSALFAYSWYREQKSGLMLFILSFPFLIPSAILGLSIIEFWNTDILGEIYQSPFMPVIGLTIRFFILSSLFLIVRVRKINSDLMEAVKLSYSFFKGFVCVILPMIRKDIFTCLLLVFALAMGEYGIALLITPPGYQMLTIKIYNYLHYGASEVVFALNFFVFVLVSFVGVLIFGLYKPEKGANRNQN